MKNAHTPEPWGLDEFGDISAGDTIICHSADLDFDNEADIHRIVACVNGCEGINPASVKAMRDALQLIADEQNGHFSLPERYISPVRDALALAKEVEA